MTRYAFIRVLLRGPSVFAAFNRPPLVFRRYFWWEIILLLLLVCGIPFGFRPFKPAFAFPYYFYLCLILSWRLSQHKWRWRLVRQTWRFRTKTSASIVLHHPAQLEGHWDWPLLLERFEWAIDDLVHQFQFRLRSPVVVFLFSSQHEIGKLFNGVTGGVALGPTNTVLLAEDTNLREFMRHEFAHLFSHRWNGSPPPLLQEGLAVWWERTRGGQPIEKLAQPLLHHRNLVLTFQQHWKPFTASPQMDACYILAGYFTAFLIRRFGWERYQRLYRRATARNFQSQFRRVFGVSLTKAESQCRYQQLAAELLARRMDRL
jgi:hypothetical protein